MIWWAIRDGIISAAKQIRPGQVLVAMCIVASFCTFIMPLAMMALEHLPLFKRQRIAEQNQDLETEIEKWRAKYGVKAARCEDLEKLCREQERIIALEKNANRNFNAQAAAVVRR